MCSVEGGFFLSSVWEGGKISWQEKVRTYFSRYHLSCTRIFSCCQGVVDIWQTLFFKLSFFCPDGLPEPLLTRGSIFALKWGRSVALFGGRSHNPAPQEQKRNYLLVREQKCCVLKSEAAYRQAALAECLMWLQTVTIKGLLNSTCPVMWDANYTKE